VRQVLAEAELVMTSSLTLVECDRTLIRAESVDGTAEAVAARRKAVLREATEHWILFDVDAEIVERACRRYPREPIRTLDALHLATAVLVQSLVPDVAVLSRDFRVRENAREMGFRVVPDATMPEPGTA
jgi:predicted nucleic acid-binding protein